MKLYDAAFFSRFWIYRPSHHAGGTFGITAGAVCETEASEFKA
jgi:hypothetical protein